MIPKSHPRYESLMKRNIIAEGYEKGIVHLTGLIAHGRGEAFDYLLGEKTRKFAEKASLACAAFLAVAKKPVISVNGNAAMLAGKEIVELAKECEAGIEVNLFHRSEERIRKIIKLLEEEGGEKILGLEGDARIDGLEHARGICSYEGIYTSDVVFVPLEDGDRCNALKKMGKIVLTVDLNPLSRTARCADVTIVDNIIRAIPNIRKKYGELDNPEKIIKEWDNKKNLQQALNFICRRLRYIYKS